MKITLLITGLAMGGAENQVVNLADKFADKGFDVTLAYMLEPALVKPSNPNIKLVWLEGTKSPLGMFKALKNFIKLVRTSKPDVVHSHMFHANILARVARVFAFMPKLISTAHNTNEGGGARMLSYRLTNFLSTVFTNVSDDAVLAFEQKNAVAKGKMLSVGNGINTNYFLLDKEIRQTLRSELGLSDKKVFIAIGRYHEQKDYPNLISAFNNLYQHNKNTHLLIVGDGELRPSIENQIQELGLQEHISLLGMRRDIPQLLSAADIYVMSSAWEGLPLVIAEAMSVEKVMVATDCGGTVQLIGDAGFIVPPKNSTALAEAMQKAINLSENEASTLGSKARARVLEHFSLDAAVDKWIEIYEFTE